MSIPTVSHRPSSTISLRALTVISVLATLASDAGGRHHHHVCPPFSCGGFHNVSYPFCRQGDPSGCGVQSCELVCTDMNATIHIGSGTYKVLSINYTYSYFWVVDASLSMQSSCPLPRWDYHGDEVLHDKSHQSIELGHYYSMEWVTFAKCSQPIENNGIYMPVACLSTNSSFIYMMIGPSSLAECFEPSCGYLAMTLLGGPDMMPEDMSYPDVVKSMRKGFAL